MSDKYAVDDATIDWLDKNREGLQADEITALDKVLTERREVPVNFTNKIKQQGILDGGKADPDTRNAVLGTFLNDHLKYDMRDKSIDDAVMSVFGTDSEAAYQKVIDIAGDVDRFDPVALLEPAEIEEKARERLSTRMEATDVAAMTAGLWMPTTAKIEPPKEEEVQAEAEKIGEKAFMKSPKLIIERASELLSPKNERLAWTIAVHKDPEQAAQFWVNDITNMQPEQRAAFWMLTSALNPQIDATFGERFLTSVANPFKSMARGLADYSKGQGWDFFTLNDNSREVFDRANKEFTPQEIGRLQTLLLDAEQGAVDLQGQDEELYNRLYGLAKKAVVVYDENLAAFNGSGVAVEGAIEKSRQKREEAANAYIANFNLMYAQGQSIRQKEAVEHAARKAFMPKYKELGSVAETALDITEGATYMASLAAVSQVPYVGAPLAAGLMYAPQQAQWERNLIYDYNVEPQSAKLLSSGFAAAYASVERLQIAGLDPAKWSGFIGSQGNKQITAHYLKQWFARGAKQSVTETTEEWLQTGIEQAMLMSAERYAGAEGIDWDEQTEAAMREMVHSAIVMPGITFMGGGLLRGKASASAALRGKGVKGAVGAFIPEEWKQAREDIKQTPDQWAAIQQGRKAMSVGTRDLVPAVDALMYQAFSDSENFYDPEDGERYEDIDAWMQSKNYDAAKDRPRFDKTIQVMEINSQRKVADVNAVRERMEVAAEDIDEIPLPAGEDADPFWGAVDAEFDAFAEKQGYKLEKYESVTEARKKYKSIPENTEGVAFPSAKKIVLIKEVIGENPKIARQKFKHEFYGHAGFSNIDNAQALTEQVRDILGDKAVKQLIGEEYAGLYEDGKIEAEELLAQMVERLDPAKIEQVLSGGSIRDRVVRWLDESMGVVGADEVKARQLMDIVRHVVRNVQTGIEEKPVTEQRSEERPITSKAIKKKRGIGAWIQRDQYSETFKVMNFVYENGPIAPKSIIKTRFPSTYRETDYEKMGNLKTWGPYYKFITGGKVQSPSTLADKAHDEGLISEATADALFDAMYSEIQAHNKKVAEGIDTEIYNEKEAIDIHKKMVENGDVINNGEIVQTDSGQIAEIRDSFFDIQLGKLMYELELLNGNLVYSTSDRVKIDEGFFGYERDTADSEKIESGRQPLDYNRGIQEGREDLQEQEIELIASELEAEPRFSLAPPTDNIDFERIEELGTTTDIREGGYIMPDGGLVDLSGKKEGGMPGSRSYDHREAGGTTGMQEFQAQGNIRYDYVAGTIDIVIEPTFEQEDIIRKIVADNDYVTVELNDGLGEYREEYHFYTPSKRQTNLEYEDAKPARVINDIRRFYAGEHVESPRFSLAAREDPSEMTKRVIAQRILQGDRRNKKQDAKKLLQQMKAWGNVPAGERDTTLRGLVMDGGLIASMVIDDEGENPIRNELETTRAVNKAADRLVADREQERIEAAYAQGGPEWQRSVEMVDAVNVKRMEKMKSVRWQLTAGEMDDEVNMIVEDETDGTDKTHNKEQNKRIFKSIRKKMYQKAKREGLYSGTFEMFNKEKIYNRSWMREGYKNSIKHYLNTVSRKLTYGSARDSMVRQIASLDSYPGIANLERRAGSVLERVRVNKVKESKKKVIGKVGKKLSAKYLKIKSRKDEVRQRTSAAAKKFVAFGKEYYKAEAQTVSERLEKIMEELQEVDQKPTEKATVFERQQRREDLMLEFDALTHLGALPDRAIGEVADALEYLTGKLERDIEAQEKRRQEIKEKAEIDRNKILGALPNRLKGQDRGWLFNMNNQSQFLEMRLKGLARYGKGAERKDALSVLDGLSFKFAKANFDQSADVWQANNDFMLAILDIYAKGTHGGNQVAHQIDRTQAAKVVRDLTRLRPEYAKFSFKERVLSKANLLQMIGLLAQEDYRKLGLLQLELEPEVNQLTKVYSKAADIARALWVDEDGKIKYKSKHGYELDRNELTTVVQSVLDGSKRGRRLEMEPAMLAEMSPQDMKLLDWFRQYYRANRDALSAQNKKITGFAFPPADTNYIPAQMDFQKTIISGYSVYMPVVPPALTPRTFNTADFNEEADIVSMWQRRLEGNMQFLHFSDLYLQVQAIFEDQKLLTKMENTHGKKYVKQLIEHMQDCISGTIVTDRHDPRVDAVTNFMAMTRLGFNISLLPRQITSLPAFAMYVRTGVFFKSINVFNEGSLERMQRILQHPYAKARMRGGNTQVLNEMLTGALNEGLSFVDLYKRLGSLPTRYGDIIPTLWFGQGYLAAMEEDAKRQGMSEEEGFSWAMAQLWTLVNNSQQSGLMVNLAEWQRRGGSLGRMFGQFQSTPSQFWAKEVFDWRELKAAFENRDFESERLKDAAKQFGKTTVINFLVLGTMYELAKIVWRMALGDEPDEDDWRNLAISSISSPFGGIYLGGAVMDAVMKGALKGERGYGNSFLPASATIDDAQTLGAMLNHFATGDPDKAMQDFDKVMRSLNPVYRDIRMAQENYGD
jgi:hypothetical protein